MELYKKEKINPLGGCLPILVQMPVFLALYWVLLESVEMRQAPWMFWITDLSIKDPYFILPIIMGATMFVQQMLNPTPPDPMQAKVMKLMPIIFTFFFLWFPAGLVLYWVVNNLPVDRPAVVHYPADRGCGQAPEPSRYTKRPLIGAFCYLVRPPESSPCTALATPSPPSPPPRVAAGSASSASPARPPGRLPCTG